MGDFTTYALRSHHVVATCKVCGWSNDNYLEAAKEADEHVIATGHDVDIVDGFTIIRTTNDESGRAFFESRIPERK